MTTPRNQHGNSAQTAVPPATLSDIGVLAGLAEDELQSLARRCNWRRYERNQQIVGHLDSTREVHFIVQGRVRVIVYSFAGKEVTFRDMAAGDLFGELSALDGQPRSANVIALEPTATAALSAEAFNALLERHPSVSKALLGRMVRQVRSLTERIFEFSTLAVKNRIHAELLRLAQDSSESDGKVAVIKPIPKHADMASRLSTHREAVTRELALLAQGGLLERRKDALVIHDVRKLAKLVEAVLGSDAASGAYSP